MPREVWQNIRDCNFCVKLPSDTRDKNRWHIRHQWKKQMPQEGQMRTALDKEAASLF